MPPIRPWPLAPSEGSSSASPYPPPPSAVDSQEKHPCDICKRSYKNSSSLERHKREKHEKAATFDCRHCGMTFQRPEGLKNHIVKKRCSAASTAGHRYQLLQDAVKMDDPVPLYTVAWPLLGFQHSASTSPGLELGRISPVYPEASTINSISHALDILLELDSWMQTDLRLTVAELGSLSKPAPSTDVHCEWTQKKRRQRVTPVWYYDAMYQFTISMMDSWDDQDRSPCTTRRSPLETLFPPAFEIAEPQDLESLIWQQDQAKRRLRVMQSFQSTHRKLTDGRPTPRHTDCRTTHHLNNIHQAWKDGVDAAQQLLSGTLPRELHSVLGVTQVASAIRSALDDVDSATASEDRSLSDLGRWRQLLPSDSHAAFDHYADLLWDKRPPSDSAWKEVHDAEALVYFQDLLAELLSHVGPSSQETATADLSPTPPHVISHPASAVCASSTLALPADNEALPTVEHSVRSARQDDLKRSTFAEVVLYSAGAIFMLIMAYILRESPPSTLPSPMLIPQSSLHRSLYDPGLMPLLHHYGASASRRSRPACLVAACVPSCELPAPRTLDPAIRYGPPSRRRDAPLPTIHNARRSGVAAAHRALFRGHC